MLDLLNFYIVVPQAATNYVTNPTPYRSTTGYTADTGSIAQSAVSGRRGPLCIKVTPTTAESGVYFGTVAVVNTEDYTFSVDVKGEDGKAMRLRVEDVGGTYTYEQTFTATGEWQRVAVSFTAQENASDYRLHVLRDATTGTNPFWVDGFQFEDGDEATTFFSGDSKGFDRAPLEFYWGGEPHNSVSYRTAETRAGGALLDIKQYAAINKFTGLGMGKFEQLYAELSSGGAQYLKHIRKPRNVNFQLTYYGTSPDELYASRAAILDAVEPDLTGYSQPLVIRFQGADESADAASQPVDIVCVFQPSHVDTPDNMFSQQDILSFTVLNCYLDGAYREGVELSFRETLSYANYVLYRTRNGVWTEVVNGTTGLNGTVSDILEAPDGRIILVGSFYDAGGVGEADYVCVWDGTAIDDLTGAADFTNTVTAVACDAAGNYYFGGYFFNIGDANGDYIVKWTGSAFVSLGTGCNNPVAAIAIDPNTGYVYVGGQFTQAGGVANTAHIAYFDGSVWHAMDTGLNGDVYCMAFAPDGNLYIGGAFTAADGADGDGLCYWDGSDFHAVGEDELNYSVTVIRFDDNGNLVVGGQFNANGIEYLATFVNGAWQTFGEGVDAEVYGLCLDDDDLYVAGLFGHAGNISLSDRIAVYSNGAWQPIDVDLPGSNTLYNILMTSKRELFVTGNYAGTAYAGSQTVVTNSGNARVYPTIEITGPGVLQSITNYSTGKGLTFNGLTIQPGETITISQESGQLLLSSSWEGRGYMQKYINPGSNIGALYLKPGDNHISLFMPSGVDGNTQAFMFWAPTFWNIEKVRYG